MKSASSSLETTSLHNQQDRTQQQQKMKTSTGGGIFVRLRAFGEPLQYNAVCLCLFAGWARRHYKQSRYQW
jgi:hypothetical protein